VLQRARTAAAPSALGQLCKALHRPRPAFVLAPLLTLSRASTLLHHLAQFQQSVNSPTARFTKGPRPAPPCPASAPNVIPATLPPPRALLGGSLRLRRVWYLQRPASSLRHARQPTRPPSPEAIATHSAVLTPLHREGRLRTATSHPPWQHLHPQAQSRTVTLRIKAFPPFPVSPMAYRDLLINYRPISSLPPIPLATREAAGLKCRANVSYRLGDASITVCDLSITKNHSATWSNSIMLFE
jgi:hypothetical protein